MGADGSSPRRISFGAGRYTTPVWSPTGEFIAFTKQTGGDFHIGVMKPDGSDERILTSSYLDEGPDLGAQRPGADVLAARAPGGGSQLWTRRRHRPHPAARALSRRGFRSRLVAAAELSLYAQACVKSCQPAPLGRRISKAGRFTVRLRPATPGRAMRLTLIASAGALAGRLRFHAEARRPAGRRRRRRRRSPARPLRRRRRQPVTQRRAAGLGAGLRDQRRRPGLSSTSTSIHVRADAKPVLDAQAAWLKRYPAVQVRIEGNCDERGTREYNLALGARRANAVRDYPGRPRRRRRPHRHRLLRQGKADRPRRRRRGRGQEPQRPHRPHRGARANSAASSAAKA